MAENNEPKLFNEFPPVSTESWEQAIIADLKGADYEKKLVWNTEGLTVRPYYRADNLKDLKLGGHTPQGFSVIKGNKTNKNAWDITQNIGVEKPEEANRKALEALKKGANTVGFIFSDKAFPCLDNPDNIAILLNQIDLTKVAVKFVAGKHAPAFTGSLLTYIAKKGLDAKLLKGTIEYNPLGYLTTTGNHYNSNAATLAPLAELVQTAAKQLPGFKVVEVNGAIFQNAGTSIVQELAFSLAMANDYLEALSDKGVSIDTAAKSIYFHFAIGPNYFFEIAKIRAARLLWAKLTEAWKVNTAEARIAYIHATTADWNQTLYDPYVNLLRTTTEGMSAVLGGVDSLSIQPFDSAFSHETALSERIARNAQIILKEEAYFDKIIDPAAGSYYIETLTNNIATQAWELLKQVEALGGYTLALQAGFIQKETESAYEKRRAAISGRRETLLGTNQYPNQNEKIASAIDESIAFATIDYAKEQIVKPLTAKRPGSDFELLRLATEKSGCRPKVFLFTIGSLTMRRARAGFSQNFFAVAGFEILDNNGFSSVDEGVEAVKKVNPQIVVICSSDEEYATLAPQIFEKLKDKYIVVIAGNPVDCIEQLKAEGLVHYVHVKSNIIETLRQYQKMLELI